MKVLNQFAALSMLFNAAHTWHTGDLGAAIGLIAGAGAFFLLSFKE